MITLTPPKKKVMIIRVTKVSIGHQSNRIGTGVHQDKRLSRKRTRGDQRRAAVREYD